MLLRPWYLVTPHYHHKVCRAKHDTIQFYEFGSNILEARTASPHRLSLRYTSLVVTSAIYPSHEFLVSLVQSE